MDATFQRDPEFYVFHCLSIEETWNYLDSQVRDVGWELKVGPDPTHRPRCPHGPERSLDQLPWLQSVGGAIFRMILKLQLLAL